MMDKEAFLQQTQARLQDHRDRLAQLKAAALRAEADRERMTIHRTIGELQSRILAIESGMNQLETSSGEVWRRLRDSVDRATADFNSVLNAALPMPGNE